jgi:hypothetical protein
MKKSPSSPTLPSVGNRTGSSNPVGESRFKPSSSSTSDELTTRLAQRRTSQFEPEESSGGSAADDFRTPVLPPRKILPPVQTALPNSGQARTPAPFRGPKKAVSTGTKNTPDDTYEVLPEEADDELSQYDWYFDEIDRAKSEQLLASHIKKNGAFIVRKRQRGTAGDPYSIDVVCDHHIYHLLIRQRTDLLFALGYEKANEKKFGSVDELVCFFRNNAMELDNRGVVQHVKLTTSPRK